jgi:hypothetical protein
MIFVNEMIHNTFNDDNEITTFNLQSRRGNRINIIDMGVDCIPSILKSCNTPEFSCIKIV